MRKLLGALLAFVPALEGMAETLPAIRHLDWIARIAFVGDGLAWVRERSAMIPHHELVLIVIGLVGVALLLPQKWWAFLGRLFAGRPRAAVLVTAVAVGLVGWAAWSVFSAPPAKKPAAAAAARSPPPVPANEQMDLYAAVVLTPYRRGLAIGGINWRREYTELHLRILNPSGYSFKDVSINIRPDTPVIEMAQVTNVPSVYLQSATTHNGSVVNITRGGTFATKMIATDGGWNLSCPSIPAGANMDVVIATSLVREGELPRGAMKVPVPGGYHSWVGLEGVDLLTAGAEPKSVVVSGQYTVNGQRVGGGKVVKVLGFGAQSSATASGTFK